MQQKRSGKAMAALMLAAVCGQQAVARPATAGQSDIDQSDTGQKVLAAEQAVRAAPQDAASHRQLGLAYLADGRFRSAEAALQDAVTLGAHDNRTIASLALVQIGLGEDAAARDLLNRNSAILSTADYGLALALAGDPDKAIQLLSQAAQSPTADARIRQNLAYSYALAGRWDAARLTAGRDLDPVTADQRITQWKALSGPKFGLARVAALLGVQVNAQDTGLPAGLGLGGGARPVADTPDVVQPDATPVTVAETPAPRKPAPPKPAPRPVTVRPVANGAWSIQLGAYESEAVAKEKWHSMAQANRALAAFPIQTSQVTVNNKAFYRLTLNGIGSRADAESLCRSVRARQGLCFVRAR